MRIAQIVHLTLLLLSNAFPGDTSISDTTSQVAVTPLIRQVALQVEIEGVDDLKALQQVMFSNLKYQRMNRMTTPKEMRIRWRRTAHQILSDRIVYEGKTCTDLTVLFIALCRAHNLSTRFVKVYKGNRVHSVAEVNIKNKWYIYDASNYKSNPIEGEITEEKDFMGWRLWRKGRDSWDIGLKGYKDIRKMCDVIDCSGQAKQ